MHRRIALGATLTFALVAARLAPAAATDGTENYYTPPKLKAQGSSSAAVTGPGVVVVKVLVAKDGSAKVQGVVRSSNHGDDSAALEIAKSSTYRPALRGKTAITAFYDYTLKFNVKGGTASSGAASGGTTAFEAQIRSGNYAAAQTGLDAYLATHPSDTKAELDLGIATAYLNQPAAAAAAFGKAGPIPDAYKALAAKAYNDAANDAYKNKDYAAAIAAAKGAVALAPGPFTSNSLGTAEDAAGDHTAAIADLEKARALAAADSSLKGADRARIDTNLVAAYVDDGKIDDAKSVAAEAAKLDPTQTGAQMFIGNYYAKTASDLVAAGKFPEGAAAYEQAALVAPSQAAQSYVEAAFAYLKIKPTALNDKAKADADKALAIDPTSATANFAAGIALANQPGKTKDALVFLNKADSSAKAGSDPALTAAIENVLKQINGTK